MKPELQAIVDALLETLRDPQVWDDAFRAVAYDCNDDQGWTAGDLCL
jgi:hypothetical protein